MINNKFTSHKMDDEGIERSNEIREKASELLDIISGYPAGREQSLAITKLEECVMWANKAIAMH